MSNNIDLKKGLDIPIKGSAKPVVSKPVVPDTVAIVPSDFTGLTPRLLVKEGDRVLAGSPVLADKKHPEILITAPLSGTVKEIVRGDKRKLLEVRIGTDPIHAPSAPVTAFAAPGPVVTHTAAALPAVRA